MKGAVKIGMFRGIAVFIHWTFFLLLGWVAYSAWDDSGQWALVGEELLMVLLVFTCVLMHEFGHALMAARYKVMTRDITLLPLGGVARLEHMPEKPFEEFMIALAGPLVNLAIIFVLIPIILIGRGWPVAFDPVDYFSNGIWLNLLMVNLSLFLFNLLPAFPMDGGRILRALLGWKFSREKATTIAAYTGMCFSVVFIAFGIYANPILALIGVFVFLSARGELQMVRRKQSLLRFNAASIMRTDCIKMLSDMTLAEALMKMTESQSGGLIIRDTGRGWAVLTIDALLRAFQENGDRIILLDLPVTFSDGIKSTSSFSEVTEKIKTTGCFAVPVVDENDCLGFITRNDLELADRLMKKAAN